MTVIPGGAVIHVHACIMGSREELIQVVAGPPGTPSLLVIPGPPGPSGEEQDFVVSIIILLFWETSGSALLFYY